MKTDSSVHPTRILALASVLLCAAQASAQPVYQWSEVPGLTITPPAIPANQMDWQLAYDAQLQLVVAAENGSGMGETTWTWNGSGWTDTGILTPAGTSGLVYDDARDAIFRLEERDAMEPMITWAFISDVGWVGVDSNGPTSRHRFGWAYDSAREKTVLFGGLFGLNSLLPEITWEWDGAAWTSIDTTAFGPVRRIDTAMAFDQKNAVVVLFGGSDSNSTTSASNFGDTWTWDGKTWTQVSMSGPSPRGRHSMIYDPLREKILLFGGSLISNDQLNDLWEWDGSSWTQIATTGPSERSSAGFAFDVARQEAVLYSGKRRVDGFPVPLPDTWRLRVQEAWVDFNYSGAETGDFSTPFNTISEAVAWLPDEGRLHIKPGSTSEVLTISKPLVIDAPMGMAVIGQ